MRKLDIISRFVLLSNVRRANRTEGIPVQLISTWAKPFFKCDKKYYETRRECPDQLKEILEKVHCILKEHNFPIYLKSNVDVKTNAIENSVRKKSPNEIDHFKLLNILNKIIAEIEKDENLKVSIWENSTFIELLSFLKIRIPIFDFDELFLFLLCFSKIQFLPQMLLIEVLNRIKEKRYLTSFYEHDKTKFLQFLLILSTLKNVKYIQSNVVNSSFKIFINNYIKILLEEIKKDGSDKEKEEEKMEKLQINEEEKKKIYMQESRQLNLNHFMLLCTALYNLNIRHFDFFYETSNKVIQILEELNFNNKYNMEMEYVDTAKKVINIYLSYCSLGFDYIYFYDKLNSFLYNMIPTISVTDCVTLLLCISTLSEQKHFQFPLCLISNLEKNLLSKFYALESKDLLLLIYLFTYLKLYLSNCERYVHMLEYLFVLRDYDKENEENKLKLFQIYLSLTGTKLPSSKTKKEIEEKGLPSDNVRNEEEKRINSLIVMKLKEKGIFDKIEQNINLSVEENDRELENELNSNIDSLKLLLENKDFSNVFKIKETVKNKIFHNYYLNHIYVVFSKKHDTGVEYRIVFHFDTATFEDLENPIDIYINMKKRHIKNLNVKFILLKFSLWKRLSKDQQIKVILKQMEDVVADEKKHDDMVKTSSYSNK